MMKVKIDKKMESLRKGKVMLKKKTSNMQRLI